MATTKTSTRKNVEFQDANFRLVVIGELLRAGYFAKELDKASRDRDVEDNETDYRLRRAIDGWKLTPAMLATVVRWAPDGGDRIYSELKPAGWDGEDGSFDVESLADVGLLPNLATVSLSAMFKRGIDLAPLRGAASLERVDIWSRGVTNVGVLDELEKRGVSVKRHNFGRSK